MEETADQQALVSVTYVGGEPAANYEVAPYNDRDSRMEHGKTYEVPKNLARRLSLSADFEVPEEIDGPEMYAAPRVGHFDAPGEVEDEEVGEVEESGNNNDDDEEGDVNE